MPTQRPTPEGAGQQGLWTVSHLQPVTRGSTQVGHRELWTIKHFGPDSR